MYKPKRSIAFQIDAFPTPHVFPISSSLISCDSHALLFVTFLAFLCQTYLNESFFFLFFVLLRIQSWTNDSEGMGLCVLQRCALSGNGHPRRKTEVSPVKFILNWRRDISPETQFLSVSKAGEVRHCKCFASSALVGWHKKKVSLVILSQSESR